MCKPSLCVLRATADGSFWVESGAGDVLAGDGRLRMFDALGGVDGFVEGHEGGW